jgi:hypothetical protein
MYILRVRFAHTQDIVSLFLRLPFFRAVIKQKLARGEMMWQKEF